MNQRTRAIKALRLLLGLYYLAAACEALAGPAEFAKPAPANFQVRPLPGHPAFVFTRYSAPAEPELLKQLVQVMGERDLGNGFDPGPRDVK